MATPRTARPGMLLDPGAPINNGLVGWWPMWEGAGGKTLDISGKKNHGTLTNGPLWAGGGIRFDGVNTGVEIGAGIRPSLPLTVHVRCIFNSLPTAGGLFTADKTETAASFHSGFLLAHGFITAGKISVNYGDNTANAPDGRRTKTGNTTPALGVVHSITSIIRGATDMTIWLNGQDDGGSYTGTGGAMVYNSSQGAIGKYHNTLDGGIEAIDGSILDCRVWNRALSALEAQQLAINPNIGLWVPDTIRYYVAAGGADVRNHIIPAYMRIAA